MSPCSPYKKCSGFYTLFFFFFFGWWIQRGDQFDINLLGVTSGKCNNEQRGNGRRGNWNKEGMLPWLKDKWNCSGCCGLHGCFRLCVRGVATGSAWGGDAWVHVFLRFGEKTSVIRFCTTSRLNLTGEFPLFDGCSKGRWASRMLLPTRAIVQLCCLWFSFRIYWFIIGSKHIKWAINAPFRCLLFRLLIVIHIDWLACWFAK